MSQQPSKRESQAASRRDFIKRSSLLVAGGAAVVGGSLNLARAAHSFGSDLIKIGLVGCGGRGTGAAIQALNTKGGDLKLVALGDVFGDRVQGCYRAIKGQHGEKVDVPNDRQFSGFDAYKKVIETDCDLVILATPPGFRPLHFAAAVDAGKHVFMEKPVAVDAQGVRAVLEANEKAKQKDLAVAVGLQRRHERKYMETVKAIQDGAIGDIILARAYWNGDKPWFKQRQKDWTELEYQMRNWYQFNWLCGDHIVEQHIHNLDVINWIMNDYPASAQGQGGSQHYNGPDHGEIFDHHFVEFTYGKGCTMLSQCRHIPGTWNAVSEHVHGTKGSADVSGSKIYDADRKLIHNFGNLGGDGHQQEHHDLFDDLRAGRIPSEGEWGAKSTFTAVLGRMATYSGQMLRWDDALARGVDIAPVDLLAQMSSMDFPAPVKPGDDGFYAKPAPGRTKVLA
jgi:myo-inositol 2-dehydrogenase / D-chiro-inositol 1-dehydrogenase